MTRMNSSLLRFRSATQRDCDTQSQDPLRAGSVEGRQADPKRKPEAKIIEAPSLRVIVSPHAAYDFARRIRMVIGDKLKALREQKNLSQGDIEKRTGLLRCYISRVENGHTVPAIETLEKLARAMEVPLYQIFYDGEKPPAQNLPRIDDGGWGSSGRDARMLGRFRRLMSRTDKGDLKLLLFMAQKMPKRKKRGNRT
jgi:transcriptional regulator with XRE-family HTH domain